MEELGELSKLRKLKVITIGATEKKCMTLCKATQKLSSLGSLRIDSVSSPPPLRTLTLYGRIGGKVDWFRNLTQLAKLSLVHSELEEGKAVEIFGALPNLVLLGLYAEACAGKELVLRQGAFLNLRELHIMYPSQLREIRFEQETLPQLERIYIHGCRLEQGINDIKHLPKLKEISLGYDCQVVSLGMLQDELNAHPNQPVLRLLGDRSDHNLCYPEGPDEYFDAVESLPGRDGESTEATTPIASDS